MGFLQGNRLINHNLEFERNGHFTFHALGLSSKTLSSKTLSTALHCKNDSAEYYLLNITSVMPHEYGYAK